MDERGAAAGVVLDVDVPTVGALGALMARHEEGMCIPCGEDVVVSERVQLSLGIGRGARRLRVLGEVLEVGVSAMGPRVARVQLVEGGWRRLLAAFFEMAPGTEEGPREAAEPGQTLLQRAFCELEDVGQRCGGTLIEAGEAEAFLAIRWALVPGDRIRFRMRRDSNWFHGVVRRGGLCQGEEGVVLSLVFDHPAERGRWLGYLDAATRRRASLDSRLRSVGWC